MENLELKQTMTSREIAEVVSKNHKDVIRSIRNMEAAWHRITGRNFALSEYVDATGRKLPMYELTKTECLYIATKFNDEARAKLILRWEQLETNENKITNAEIQQARTSAKRRNEISIRVHDIDSSINSMMSERKALLKERHIIDNRDYAVLSFPIFPEWDSLRAGNPLNNEKTLND
jgi:Rha family phage regulatory protein